MINVPGILSIIKNVNISCQIFKKEKKKKRKRKAIFLGEWGFF
jgi:hypothetical protein